MLVGMIVGVVGATIVVSFVDRKAILERHQTARGSYARYVLTTKCIIIKVVLSVLLAAAAVLWMLYGSYVFGGVYTICFGLEVFLVHLLLKDDNWFKRQGKRLKKKLQELRTRTRTLPAPSPA